MRIGHQLTFMKTNSVHRFCYGGILRNRRIGRQQRPLSCKEPLHLVFKVDKLKLRQSSLRAPVCFSLIRKVIHLYSVRYSVKIEQLSIQNDHIHILIRCPRRSHFHHFFRTVAGQIAQRFQVAGLLGDHKVTDTPKKRTGLWKYRPFTRVVRG